MSENTDTITEVSELSPSALAEVQSNIAESVNAWIAGGHGDTILEQFKPIDLAMYQSQKDDLNLPFASALTLRIGKQGDEWGINLDTYGQFGQHAATYRNILANLNKKSKKDNVTKQMFDKLGTILPGDQPTQYANKLEETRDADLILFQDKGHSRTFSDR